MLSHHNPSINIHFESVEETVIHIGSNGISKGNNEHRILKNLEFIGDSPQELNHTDCVTISSIFFLQTLPFSVCNSLLKGLGFTKLQKKYESDKEKFAVLQAFLEVEIAEGKTKAKNSATDALLWLKRALEFIGVFLADVLTGQPDLSKCSKKAYESTLKKYHGWMVQGIFSLAMKAVPYRDNFITALGNGASEEEVLKDMQAHVQLMGKNIEVINDFYIKMGEDKSDKV